VGTEDFLAACRRLGQLDLTAETATTIEVGLEVEMSPRYAIPIATGWRQGVDNRGKDNRNRRGQWHELVQHLTDLAYLTLADFQEWHLRRAAEELPDPLLLSRVVTACRTFVGEDRSGDYDKLPSFPASGLAEQLGWVEDLLSLLVYRTECYTSFDGDLPVDYGYRVGERSAFGRSLAFRVRTYFYTFTSADRELRHPYFRRSDLKYLHALDNALGDTFRDRLPERDADHLHPEIIQLLGSADLLFDHYRRANRLTARGKQGYFWLYRSDADMIEVGDEVDEDRLERLSRRAGRRVGRESFHQESGTNHLGIRLLQIGLWRAGCYQGRLDGAFGPLSHRAALRLVEQERERGEILRRKQYDRVLLPVEDGRSLLWVVDLRLMAKLLEAYAPSPREEAEAEEERLWNDIRGSGGEKRLEAVLRERPPGFRQAYGQLDRHPLRRVYYGLRGLIRGAFRAAGRVVSWLIGHVRDVLGAVFDFVKAVVKRIQEGAGLFFAGFRFFAHYLLGRPIVTVGRAVEGNHPVLLTRHLIDLDVVNLADAFVSEEDVALHGGRVSALQRGGVYFVEATATLLRFIGTLQPPVGWLRLGIYLARRVRRLLMATTDRSVA
jgi:hypothetical protein